MKLTKEDLSNVNGGIITMNCNQARGTRSYYFTMTAEDAEILNALGFKLTRHTVFPGAYRTISRDGKAVISFEQVNRLNILIQKRINREFVLNHMG